MKQTEIIKGRGIKRKTSLGLVCGISLMGALFLGANGVSADEVTPTTPTTATASESKTVVVDEGLTETANKAKEAGLTINAEPTKNIGTANTEEEATKLAEQAKKEVADQKTQIEKETADYQKAKSESGNQEKEIVKSVLNEPIPFAKATHGLRYLQDKDFEAGKTSLGNVVSSKGNVSYVSPSTTSVMMDDPTTMRNFINNSQVGTTPTEMTIGYQNGDMLVATSPIADKKLVKKVVPVFLKEGEGIAYDINVTDDSNLGSLGVAKVRKQYVLDKTPVQNGGKVVAFLSQQGSVEGQVLIGGAGKANEVLKEGDWTYSVEYKYFDKNNKPITMNELFARYSNKYLLNGKELIKPSDIYRKGDVDTLNYPSEGNGFETTKVIHVSGVKDAIYVTTATEKITGLAGVSPVYYAGQHSALAPVPVDTSKLDKEVKAPTVNYHLVSYTVNKAKATNNTDKLKKGSIVQVFIEEGGKEIAPKTNTGEKPVDETVTLNHPKEILFEGKTYTFTKQDKADPTKIPNGQETITYIYKLKETPKPVVVEEKKGDVEVRYVKDDASRTVLKEPVADTTQAKVGTKYDTTDHKPVTITKDGVTYELVRTEGKETGDVVKGKTVVTYVYREVQKPVTIHIDKEGNPVAPKEDGTKPFKDIEGYKPEPKDPKNVEDPKGVTVRVYEKVTPKPETPKTPETPQTPNTPEAPKPQPQQPTQAVVKATLPQTGEVASLALTLAGLGLLGLSGLVTKKRED